MPRPFSGSELVVATHNKGKLAEIRELLQGRVEKLYAAADFGLAAPAETGVTFAENAELKARFVAAATGKIALADDSGFCVAALRGAPGVYSADWAETPQGRDFSRAMHRVHAEMGAAADQSAAFVCVLSLCWPDGHCETVEGRINGRVVWPPRGGRGFGYDPMFAPAGGALTYGEIDPAEKNRGSHRARAFQALLDTCFR